MLRILVPLDGSQAAEHALSHAVAISQAFPAQVTLLQVIASPESDPTQRSDDTVDFALRRHQAKRYLDAVSSQCSGPEIRVRCEVSEGNPADTIVRYADAEQTDLLILARYGRGCAERFAAGGTAQKIVSSAPCSVLLLDPRCALEAPHHYQRILVTVDSSKSTDCAVSVAAMLAERHSASLVLLDVVEELQLPRDTSASPRAQSLKREMHRLLLSEAEHRLNELVARIRLPVSVEKRAVIAATPAMAIESIAEEMHTDLLLSHTIETHGAQISGFGAINQSLVQYSHRALFVLRPSSSEGFVSNFRSVFPDEPRLEAS